MEIRIELYPHQRQALEKLKSGSILCGGVGTGKSITSLAYFFTRECGGSILKSGSVRPPLKRRDLYIITTARKRDTKEWDMEIARFPLAGYKIVVDSWNNVEKYRDIRNAFFLFDEQRVVGSGSWAKSFITIARQNRWLLLSATPGDTWMDYIPVFVANGFYKNRSAFLRRHAVYNRYAKYPKVDKWVDVSWLEELRRRITVTMSFERETHPNHISVPVQYDDVKVRRILKDRWNPFDEEPIQDISEAFRLMQKVVNSDPSRTEAVVRIMKMHPKLIIFYTYDYELEILRNLPVQRPTAEWNGHYHQPIPDEDAWNYLVQYTAGAEGWNCVETDAILFYSQNYSYKLMTQAAGRIDRLNTPFTELYYYTLRSSSVVDQAIGKALGQKRNFNERAFVEQLSFGF